MSEPTTDIVLNVENLSKKFSKDIKFNMYYGILELLSLGSNQRDSLRTKEFWALRNINFQLHRGDICGVLGENGSGKTSLMRIISGIYPYSLGKIEIPNGIKTTPIFAVKAGLSPLFTGFENIYILGSVYGMSKEEIDSKMEFITSFSELGDNLNTPTGNYSSGMRARLGYVIAAATDPDIFIIDEALAVGDVAFRAKCFNNLDYLASELGKAILFVTNNNLKIERIANRVVIMKHGHILVDSRDIKGAMDFYTSPDYKKITAVTANDYKSPL